MLACSSNLGGPGEKKGGWHLTKPVLQRRADLVQVLNQLLEEGRLGARLPLAEDGSGPQDDGLVEAEVLDGVLDADLHLGVGHEAPREGAGARARDVDVGLDAGGLGGLGVLDAQVVVDLPLVRQRAGGGARGAHGVEDERRDGLQGRDEAAPLGAVGLDERLELGRLGLGSAPGDGLDGGDKVGGEERLEDLATHGAGAAKYCCGGHDVLVGCWELVRVMSICVEAWSR